MHKLFQRQLQRYLNLTSADAVPREWRAFLKAVSEAYEQADADRGLLERSLELTSQELIMRNQELARSNQELAQFAYVASHDLQEPLRMVASYTQLLARRYQGKLDADADEFISYATEGATRMQRLIDDLLEYSRVGRKSRFEPTDCQALMEEICSNLQVAVEESGATVSYDDLPTVMADRAQLIRLFQNLLGNAIKFRRKEERANIRVSAERRQHDWLFAVRDNGIGIEPKHLDRLFTIFQRLHTRSEYPGTGIGLAICKKIVEQHGGRISVESAPNQGSTFYFSLPAVETRRAAKEESAHASAD